MTTLSDKIALVTGASHGIGRASALALARAGVQALVPYARGAAEAPRYARAPIGPDRFRRHRSSTMFVKILLTVCCRYDSILPI
jgi:NAD(P)-dependent dehydrogenase (short-subunit alcohol dehydrogenase family)